MLLRFVGGRIKMFEKLPIRNSVKDLHKLVEGMGMWLWIAYTYYVGV